MKLTDREFFLEQLDLTIPEMKSAADAFSNGCIEEAERIFVRYFKGQLRDDIIFKLHPRPMTDGVPKGHTMTSYADLVVDGHMYAIGFLHKYENKKIVWDYNPTFNGYVEYCFHLNGHGDASALAYTYRETKDEKYAVRFAELMRSWLDDTECPGKVVCDVGRPTWRSIESGGRMVRWPSFFASLKDSPSVPDRLWLDMAKSVVEHMDRLIGLNTKYNWHTIEMVGVLTAAMHYPCFKYRNEWREHAVRELIKQYEREIYPDGMQQELSSSYQNSVASNMRYAKRLLEFYGYEAPKELSECIKLVMSSYTKLVRPDLMATGLNDAGTVEVPKILADKQDIYPEDEVMRYFITERREGKKPDFKSIVMPYSGFVIMRTGWEADDMWTLFDVGPEGTAHIHEDKLNFLLYAYGEMMLDDIGFYSYDTSDMRYFSISSLAHNTGLVDGEGQNRIATHVWGAGIETVEIQTPAWGEYAERDKLCDLCYSDGEICEVAEASFDGDYGKNLTKATHTRKVVFFKNGLGAAKPFYLLLDSFEAKDGREHEFSVSFQHRPLPISVEARSVKVKFDSGATLTTVSDVSPSVLLGQYSPRYVGWYPIHSPYEHEHTPSPFVEFKKRGVSAELVTVVYPSPTDVAPNITVTKTDGGFALGIDGENFEFKYTDDCFKAKKYTV